MNRPAASLVEAEIPCAPGLDGDAALGACERAAVETSFRVVVRTRGSLVLLPVPRRGFARCMLPGAGALMAKDPRGGRGITVELVESASRHGGGRVAIAVAAHHPTRSEAFVTAVRSQLSLLAASTAMEALVSAEPPSGVTARIQQEKAYYFVSRILSNRDTEAGQEAADFCEAFAQKHSGLPATPCSVVTIVELSPMVECSRAADKLCRLVEQVLGADGPRGTVLRNAMERCILARVGPLLWRVYAERSAELDHAYANQVQALASVPDSMVLEALEVPRHFRGRALEVFGDLRQGHALPGGKDGEKLLSATDSIGSCDTVSTAAVSDEGLSSRAPTDGGRLYGFDFVAEDAEACPYQRASAALSRVSSLLRSGRSGTPREALEELTISQLEMKTCAFEASGGLEELCAMDDILPLFIFVLIRSSLKNPVACSQLLNDTLSYEERLDSEGRAVLLLESAARHVAEDWDTEALLQRARATP